MLYLTLGLAHVPLQSTGLPKCLRTLLNRCHTIFLQAHITQSHLFLSLYVSLSLSLSPFFSLKGQRPCDHSLALTGQFTIRFIGWLHRPSTCTSEVSNSLGPFNKPARLVCGFMEQKQTSGLAFNFHISTWMCFAAGLSLIWLPGLLLILFWKKMT